MAKRRRLIPSPQIPAPAERPAAASRLSAPPIAQVAAEASSQAALEALSQEMHRARQEGRLVLSLDLDAIQEDYLVRDRLRLDEEELTALMGSIRDHGQRAPVEVVGLGEGRYGLISGWRRMQALRALAKTGTERPVLAFLRLPETASDAYIAMVEENEIRQGLSYYERGRIAARAVDLGVFETERQALQQLYAGASRARRSKIGSFLALYRRLDTVLRFPVAIPERLGLALIKALETGPEAQGRLLADLRADPPATAEAEALILQKFIAAIETQGRKRAEKAETPPPKPMRQEIRPGIFLEVSGGFLKPVLTLSGPKVGPDFRDRLERWLSEGHAR